MIFQVICDLILPFMVLIVIIYGLYKKRNIYDDFIDGARQSFDMIISMFPCILAFVFGINILLNSGIITKFFSLFSTYSSKVPLDIFPMALLRPISGTSALAILNSIFEASGPDSLAGRIASVIQGSTDTTIYVLTLYFGSIGIKKIKYALWVGLLADLISIIVSIILVNLLFIS